MSDIAIKVENLSKQYRLGAINHGMLYKDLQSWWARVRGKDDPNAKIDWHGKQRDIDSAGHFWALKDVSFEVKQGDVIGIIGRNGAGKSTLLKILSRVTTPTEGLVKIKGRIASLLEVGTGFHPELTGRENVFLNGAILGMTKKEISKKFDEIVEFSELSEFIDTPVKRYSSGMYVRLAFAVAAHLEPEILLIDEVLAVGDAAFQKKCLGKMGDVSKQGRTILFVSHNMGAVNTLCKNALWIQNGVLKEQGRVDGIIEQYMSSSYERNSRKTFITCDEKKGYIKFAALLNDSGVETTDFHIGEEPIMEIGYVLKEGVRGFHVACIVTSGDGYLIFATADSDANSELLGQREAGDYTARVKLPLSLLNSGIYNISIGMGIAGIETFDRQDAMSFTIHDTGSFATMKERDKRAGLLLVEAIWTY